MKRVRFSDQVQTYTPVMDKDDTFIYLLRLEPLHSEEDIVTRSSPFQSQRQELKQYMHSLHRQRKEKNKKRARLQQCFPCCNH